MKYNIDKLLFSDKTHETFLANISVSEQTEANLKFCTGLIRKAILAAFAEIREAVRQNQKHPLLNGLSEEETQALVDIIPKFAPQGSTVYKTLNYPAHNPPQQIDSDYGTYLPMSFIEGNPVLSKKIFFKIVDTTLKELVKEKRWLRFEEKDTCARIIVDSLTHIDVPLYAIPDERFAALTESKMIKGDDTGIPVPAHERWLDPSQVYLALRDNTEHWIVSDPAKIRRWFEEEIRIYKERLRRVCRYLKAWRDFTWEKGGPSSITLMICVWETFRSNTVFDSDTDALLKVAEELPSYLNGKVLNPSDNSEEIYPRKIESTEQQEHVSMAENFNSYLARAIQRGASEQDVINDLQKVFGERIPRNTSLIERLSVAAVVVSQKKQTQPRPEDIPKNMHSG